MSDSTAAYPFRSWKQPRACCRAPSFPSAESAIAQRCLPVTKCNQIVHKDFRNLKAHIGSLLWPIFSGLCSWNCFSEHRDLFLLNLRQATVLLRGTTLKMISQQCAMFLLRQHHRCV